MFRKMKKKIRGMGDRTSLLSALLLAVLLSGCADEEAELTGSGTAGATEEESSSVSIVFEGQDTEGNAVSSDILAQSRLTMINVWATYCNPCLREMPELGQLPDEYDAADFQLIGIISDVMEDADQKTMDAAKSLIEQTGADYPHLLLNPSLYEALLTDVTAVPTTFFLDAEGNVLDTVVGAMDKEAWEEKINGLLEEL